MKRILNYTLLLLFIMLGTSVNGQVLTDDPDPNGGGGELDGVSCKNKDYQFKIDDKFYFTSGFLVKTKAFICTANLPLDVVIVEAQSDQNPNPPPIMPNEIRWSKNGEPAPSNINKLKLLEVDFANNVSEVEIIVVFSLPQQGDIELKMKTDYVPGSSTSCSRENHNTMEFDVGQ